MDRLKQVIPTIDMNNPEAHRYIFSHINQNIIPSPSSPLRNQAPPLQVIIYAIQNILHPSLNPSMIPDLLDLLSHVDFIRQRAVEKAREALIWNDYYSKADGGYVLLEPHDVRNVSKVADKKRAVDNRKTYRDIVFGCCDLHIHHLWTSDERKDQRLEHFITSVNNYFPVDDTRSSPRLFHVDLSDSEREELRATEEDCLDFMESASIWETKREELLTAAGVPAKLIYGDSPGMSYDTDFAAEFPSPVDVEELVKTIEWYVQNVEKKVERMEDVFGNRDLPC